MNNISMGTFLCGSRAATFSPIMASAFDVSSATNWVSNPAGYELMRYDANGVPLITLGTLGPHAEGDAMRGLFCFYLVDPATDEILDSYVLVADSPEKARLKGTMLWQRAHADVAFNVDDYDIIVNRVGDVRPKPKKAS